MKLEFSQSDYSTEIMLYPETAEEMAQLLRMVKNSKAQKPELYLSFSSNQPWGLIGIKRQKPGYVKNVGAFSNGNK